MEVGVRTRAQALAMARKSEIGESPPKLITRHFRRRRGDELSAEENSVSSSPSSTCCSSSGSSSECRERKKLKATDLEDENSTCNYGCREINLYRREKTPCSEMESVARSQGDNSPARSTAEKMPSDAELEEFFSAAEKQIQKQFTDKYNFDVVKEVPLEGRYEWVQMKP